MKNVFKVFLNMIRLLQVLALIYAVQKMSK